MSTTAATAHQSYQTVPYLSTPLTNPDGTISIPWYQFLVSLAQRTGMTTPGTAAVDGLQSSQNSVVLGQTSQAAGAPLAAYSALSGDYLGTLQLADEAGGPAEPQTLTTSPWTFTAAMGGTLEVFSGAVEISRDGGVTWYTIGLCGGAVPVLLDDQVMVTWYSTDIPVVVFLPTTVIA